MIPICTWKSIKNKGGYSVCAEDDVSKMKKDKVVEVIDDDFKLPEWIKKITQQEIEDEIIRILLEEGKIKEGEYSREDLFSVPS